MDDAKCPRCQGEKGIWRATDYGQIKEVCRLCGGKGTVEACRSCGGMGCETPNKWPPEWLHW